MLAAAATRDAGALFGCHRTMEPSNLGVSRPFLIISYFCFSLWILSLLNLDFSPSFSLNFFACALLFLLPRNLAGEGGNINNSPVVSCEL